MSEEVKKTRINVEKADLPLVNGESVNNFMSMVRESVRAHLFDKMKIKVDRDKGIGASVWVMDVFGDQVVAEVNTWEEKKPTVRRFMAVPMKRDANGTLEFGDPVEVVRRVSYVPKVQFEASVNKSVGEGVNSIWVGVV